MRYAPIAPKLYLLVLALISLAYPPPAQAQQCTPSDPPFIWLIGTSTFQLEQGAEYIERGATAFDSCDGDLTGAIVVAGEIDTRTLGIQQKMYTVTDSGGNITQLPRTVEVIQAANPCLPTINCPPGPIAQGGNFTISVTNPCPQNQLSYQWMFNGQVVADGPQFTVDNVDCDDAGIYTVTISNAAGTNSITLECRIIVEGCDEGEGTVEGEGSDEGQAEGEGEIQPCELYPTCFSGLQSVSGSAPFFANPQGYVTGQMDISIPPGNPTDDVNWQPPGDHNEPPGPNAWQAVNLGQVFGIALDNAAPPNRYVTATTVYGDFAAGPSGFGAVYRIDGVTGNICTLTSLPNAGPALGNICFDPVDSALFVSNHEDGLIYRIPINGGCTPSGPITTYDHGTAGRVAAGFTAMADAGTSGTFTALGRRPWGMEVYGGRLFYGVWWEHGAMLHPTEDNEVWSVALDGAGLPDASTCIREFQIPVYAGMPPSDISFTQDGDMFVSERQMQALPASSYPGENGDRGQLHLGFSPAHQAQLIKFIGSSGGPWTTIDDFRVGSFWQGRNSAGGSAVDCDENVWSTGDAIHLGAPHSDTIYGLHRIDAPGNVSDTPFTLNGLVIGLFGPGGSWGAKSQVGDVELWCPCDVAPEGEGHSEGEGEGEGLPEGEGEGEGCMQLNVKQECDPNTGDITVFVNILNESGTDATNVLLTPQTGGVTITPANTSINIPNNASATVTATLSGAAPGTTVCFTVTLIDLKGKVCCSEQICIETDCRGCLKFVEESIGCDPTRPGSYVYTFSFVNLTGGPVSHVYLYPPSGSSMLPGHLLISPAVANNATAGPFSVVISTSQAAGSQYCFGVSAHNERLDLCCIMDHCVTIPDCDGGEGEGVHEGEGSNEGEGEGEGSDEGEGPCDEHLDCDDGDPCTQDVCRNGICYHLPIPGCEGEGEGEGEGAEEGEGEGGPCQSPADCDDDNPCTIDECINGQCIHTLIVPCDPSEGEGEGEEEGEGQQEGEGEGGGGSSGPCNTWSEPIDFEEGFGHNIEIVQMGDDTCIQLADDPNTWPYIGIANSARDTLVRAEVNSGNVIGEYKSRPDGRFGNPSRTTVDALGNIWVGNRNEGPPNDALGGSVTRIGLIVGGTRVDAAGNPDPTGDYVSNPSYCTCEDRDLDGLIKTSKGYPWAGGSGDYVNTTLPWPNTAGADSAGGVSTAEDECITAYVRVTGTNVRTVAVDPFGDVWTGGLTNRLFQKVKASTATVVPSSVFNSMCGGYGGLVDPMNVIWSAFWSGYGPGFMRYDVPFTSSPLTCINNVTNYGVAIDPATCHIWTTAATIDNNIREVDPAGNLLNIYSGYGSNSPNQVTRGLVIGNGTVWVGHSGGNTVGRITTGGVHQGNVVVGSGPTGVAIDSNGKVWSTNLFSHTASRIDPTTIPGTVDLTLDLGPNSGPYNYSDMTGHVLFNAVAPQGSWTTTYDSGVLGCDWSPISWTAFQGPGTTITVQVRASDSPNPSGPWTVVQNNVPFTGVLGRYIQVQVILTRPAKSNAQVKLCELKVCKKGGCMELDIVQKDCDAASGDVTTSFTVTNTSGQNVQTILITPQTQNVSINPNLINVNLPNGATHNFNATVSGAVPGEITCFTVTFISDEGHVCCSKTFCTRFDCSGCLEFLKERLICDPDNPGSFLYTFQVKNRTNGTLYHVYIQPPAGTTLTTYLPLSPPLGPSQISGPLTVSVTTNLAPGTELCFDYSAHDQFLNTCCEGTQCITVPDCEEGPCRDDLDCDDGDPCTRDRCDPATGACVHIPIPGCEGEGEGEGQPDGEGDPCAGLNCDDQDPCTTDRCDPLTGACVHIPIPGCEGEGEGEGHPDGEGPCQSDFDCDDGDPCTNDICDPSTGICTHFPLTGCEGEGGGEGEPCQDPVEEVCADGVRDEFSTANGDEPTSPSATLLASAPCQKVITQFDVMPKGACWLHSFSKCCMHDCKVLSAKLTLSLKANPSAPPVLTNDDTIRLGSNGVGLWMGAISNLDTNGQWISGFWNPGDTRTITLELTSLPFNNDPDFNVNITRALEKCELDILVEDFTGVDFAVLDIKKCCDPVEPEGEGQPCAVKLDCGAATFERGTFAQICVTGDIDCLGPQVSYQWYKDNVLIATTTSPCLTWNPIGCNDAGLYHVDVVTPSGTITLPPCRVRVTPCQSNDLDQDGDAAVNLQELLRVIQFFNLGGYHCDASALDGYAPGQGDQQCAAHALDYNPTDWVIGLQELLRAIQFFNLLGYHACDSSPDGFCAGQESAD